MNLKRNKLSKQLPKEEKKKKGTTANITKLP
jgi:hypothetical protein